ncbi:E3 ubiquitin-protein ligase RSL1-like [Lotus japonicus]|uniref:E3 ubiquitin-protein ligase RSL1-like n=1 Tax=Lotus japonicus TaxID=34305 RepID=UPI00258AA7CD|nr:E3 ubiquitin-protein ligase RSL1-like [Lotus japonicus]
MSLKTETPSPPFPRRPRKRGVVPSSTAEVIDLRDSDDDVKVLNIIPPKTPSTKRRKFKRGESSNDAPFVCEICTDTKTTRDSFTVTGCSHAYCSDCVSTYIGTKVEDNGTNIRCPVPGCSGQLEAENCRSILLVEVLDRWLMASCEAMIAASEKFYCPFKDCSALLVNDGKEKVRESECPSCRRLFCAQCKVPWHAEVTCKKFQKLGKDERGNEDIMLMKLAKDKKWKRCPHCKYYVTKSEGCSFIRCRCGSSFCYRCGTLDSCNSHYCKKCKRSE